MPLSGGSLPPWAILYSSTRRALLMSSMISRHLASPSVIFCMRSCSRNAGKRTSGKRRSSSMNSGKSINPSSLMSNWFNALAKFPGKSGDALFTVRHSSTNSFSSMVPDPSASNVLKQNLERRGRVSWQ